MNTVLIVLACLFAPPVLGGLTAGSMNYCQAKKEGRQLPSLFQTFSTFMSKLRQPAAGQRSLQWALLSLSFQIAAIVLLGLQKTLPPVLLLYTAGAWVLLFVTSFRPVSISGPDLTHAVRSLLTLQPLLFLVMAGLYFVTGGFSLQILPEIPRVLGIDLPLLWLILPVVEYETRQTMTAYFPADGPLASVMALTQCYASGSVLLLAGFFWTRSVAGAMACAVILQISLSLLRFVRAPWLSKLADYWGYVYFTGVVNLLWVYIKYWQ